MAFKPITIDEILDTLNDSEYAEVLRDDFSIPLKIYLDGFNSNPILPRRSIVVDRFRIYARNRAAVRNEIARNPDVAKTPVDTPLVIIGLPRSGTTLLQRLLSSDPRILTPMFWEMLISTPPGRPDDWKESERYKKTLEIEEFKIVTNGAFDHIHKLRLGLDAECLNILEQYFIDTIEPLSFAYMDKCRDFMYNCPKEHVKNAYEFHKMCLKCIFYGNLTEGKSLLLKASLHLLNLEAFRAEYPNAKFIYPYRNLKNVIGSLASMQATALQLFDSAGDAKDMKDVGRISLEYIKECTTRLVRVLKTWPEDYFIKIAYTDLVQDPMGTIRKVYSHFNLQLTPEAEKEMQRYLQENTQNKHGKHLYSLEEFGITDENVINSMPEYLEYFKNGNEKLI